MLHLASTTEASWAERASADLAALLLDHAHLEKKAASTALNLIFQYPDRSPLVPELSRLAREELEHFELVLEHLDRRGLSFQPQHPASYAQRLRSVCRSNAPER